MKRTEVRVPSPAGNGHYWAPARLIGNDDELLVVEYTDIFGKVREGLFYDNCVRQVDAEITDELLKAAANAAVSEIRQHTVMLEDAVLETVGKDVLHALRLRFGFPS